VRGYLSAVSTHDPAEGETYGDYSVDDEDQLQPSDFLLDRGVSDALDEGYSPPERWSGAERYGNTPWEEEHGESLEQRIAQEEPELDPYLLAELEEEHVGGEVGFRRAGRLVADDEAMHDDVAQDLMSYDVGIDGAGASAEEAAVHIIDDETPLDDEIPLEDLPLAELPLEGVGQE
jgi:Family of unknown function (DUF5709)